MLYLTNNVVNPVELLQLWSGWLRLFGLTNKPFMISTSQKCCQNTQITGAVPILDPK